jgi:hypothetical protein
MEIGLRYSITTLGGPTIATTSTSGPGLGLISSTEGPRSAFDIGTKLSSPDRTLGVGIEPLASGEVLRAGFGISSLSRMEGLNKSYVNMSGGGGLWFNPNQARASALPLLD